MGLLNLIFLKKAANDQTNVKEQTHYPPIPSFIVPGAASQMLLIAMLVNKFYQVIPTRDLLFCTLYPTYLILANHYRFGNNIVLRQRPSHHPANLPVAMTKIFSEADTPWFGCYMATATVVGIILPLITVSSAPANVSDAAISPLILMCTQIACETAAMLNPYVHRFIAFLIPVGFFIYRESLLFDWFSTSLSIYQESTDDSWNTFGLILSLANLILFTLTLLVFTPLRWAPELLADDKCESPQVEWKMMVPYIYPNKSLQKKNSNIVCDEIKGATPAKAA